MSTGNDQPAMSSTGDEQTPKVRKPYTISKQREKWTDEEHNKFLEALKLHGRAWRKIEEHIGTKTTVQIRSHAQKFFSKVIREAAGGNSDAMKPMDIPPPRPKRKPSHPYPRKSGSVPDKSLPVLKKLEKGLSNNEYCSSDQENRSPTSVLSTVVSDIMGESASNIHTPDSYDINGSDRDAPLPIQQQPNRSKSQHLSVQEDTESPTTEEKSDMEVDTCTTATEAPVTSLKLFGRTVVTSDAHEPPSCIIRSVKQCNALGPITDDENIRVDNAEKNVQAPVSSLSSDGCVVPGEGLWNPWPCMTPLMFYCLPSQPERKNPSEGGPLNHPPLWMFYGGLPPFPYLHHPLSFTPQHPEDESQKEEGSQSASNETPDMEAGGASTSPKLNHPKYKARGFVPYKRCLVEREVEQSNNSKFTDEGR